MIDPLRRSASEASHHDLRPPRHVDVAAFIVIVLCAAALVYAITVLLK